MTIPTNEYKFEITMQSPSKYIDEVQADVKKSLSYITGTVEVKPLEQPKKEPEAFEHYFTIMLASDSPNRDIATAELADCLNDGLPGMAIILDEDHDR
jgi:hypothetical protein